MAITDPRQYLQSRLDIAFFEQWDPRRPTRVEIVHDDNSFGLRFFCMKRGTEWSLVHQEPTAVLLTIEDVDEFIAGAISAFLMKHPNWHR